MAHDEALQVVKNPTSFLHLKPVDEIQRLSALRFMVLTKSNYRKQYRCSPGLSTHIMAGNGGMGPR